MKRRIFLTLAAAAAGVLFNATAAQAADPVKIGFLVKQPEEPWFQDEWKFAEIAAKEKGFTLVKIGATDGKSFIQMAASMTGLSEAEYRDMMLRGGRSVEGNRVLGEDGDAQPRRQPQGSGKSGWDH